MGKGQFAAPHIAHVVGDDGVRAAREGKFDKVVVGFVRQIGPPEKVDARPLADGKEPVNVSFGMIC